MNQTMKAFWDKYKVIFRIALGGLMVLIGMIWLFTPIPGSFSSLIPGLYLINKKWAKKQIAHWRKKFKIFRKKK